ncbi:MAG: helix-turn-helix transcriptional regulator [Actinoplanes sp.]
MTVLFETTDVASAHHTLSTMYRLRRCAASGEDQFLRLRRDTSGPLELHHITLTMTCQVVGEPLGQVFLGHVIDGGVTYQHGRDRYAWHTGDAFLAAQPDLPYRAEVTDADIEYISFDAALLARVADTAPNRSAEPIRFTGYQPATQRDAVLWCDTFAYVRDTVGRLPAGTAPLVLGSVSRLLAATALATFPNTALHDPTVSERRDAHPASLRRAVAFIDENAHRDISAADIAVAANVTLRTLQLAFRRHLQSTPRAYLRRVRLDRVHDALRTADPEATTVMAEASRWGFINHSRFTAFYHATYGITPSHTLRYI